MTISLPAPLRDSVQDSIESGQYGSASDDIRDLIRRDPGGVEDEDRWLRGPDASLAESLGERDAGGGIDFDAACETVATALKRAGGDADR